MPDDIPECPECGREMKIRNGKNGDFWGCSGFPDCRGSMNLDFEDCPCDLKPCNRAPITYYGGSKQNVEFPAKCFIANCIRFVKHEGTVQIQLGCGREDCESYAELAYPDNKSTPIEDIANNCDVIIIVKRPTYTKGS